MNFQYKPILPQTPQPIIIIGAGGIVGDAHLPAYQKAGFVVYGITNRTRAKAEELAKRFSIEHVYDSVEAAATNGANRNWQLMAATSCLRRHTPRISLVCQK